MQDFNELKQAKATCLKDITEALPRYSERLAAIDQRLTEYVEDALSGNASHCWHLCFESPANRDKAAIKRGECRIVFEHFRA